MSGEPKLSQKPEARFHRAVATFLTKKEQGHVMGAYRVATAFDEEAEREMFEEAVYQQYFLSNLNRIESGPMAGWFAPREPLRTKADMMVRVENGSYRSPPIDAAWWAWQQRAKL
jgi:hypothetical protein